MLDSYAAAALESNKQRVNILVLYTKSVKL